MTYAEFLARLDSPRPTPTTRGTTQAHRAYCPAHQQPPHRPGRGRTLSVAEATSGAILIHCHAGCAAHDITRAMGIDPGDLFPPRGPDGGGGGGGNGGPAAWASAAAAADAAADRLIEALASGGGDRLFSAIEALDTFTRLARRAIRGRG